MGSRCCYFSSLDTCINENSCESLQKVLSAVFQLTSFAMHINSTLPVIASSRRNNKNSVKPVIKFQQSNLLPVYVILRKRLVHKSRACSFRIFRNKNLFWNIFRNIFRLFCSWEQKSRYSKMRIAPKQTLTRIIPIIIVLIPD